MQEGTIKSRLSRARALLKEQLTEEGSYLPVKATGAKMQLR